MKTRRAKTTRSIGHARFKGHNLTVYDRAGDQVLIPTIFPPASTIKGPFGKKFQVEVDLHGTGRHRIQMQKSARHIAGGRTVPVLEAEL